MKLSDKTLKVLKNYSTINPSIMFRNGSELRTVSPQKTILAKCKIQETIEQDFGIFDLNRLLGVLSLFDSPEIFTEETNLKISDGKKAVNFIYADPVTMVLPPNKDIPPGKTLVSFSLTNETFQDVMKAANVLQLPEFAIVGNGSDLSCKAIDSKNPSSNNFEVKIGHTELTFNMIFSCANLKLLPGDYEVNISNRFGHFVNNDMEYWITVENSSTWSE